MKRLALILTVLPCVVYAGVIVKTNGDRLEDVSIQSSENNVFVYVDEDGKQGSVPRSEVSAVLYDDGRYEEIKQEVVPEAAPIVITESAEDQAPTEDKRPAKENPAPAVAFEGEGKQYNVYAYGVYAGMGYFSGEKYEGIKVEYRVIYKSQKEEPEFQYLGTSPFAYVTDKMSENSFVGRGNPYLMNLIEPKPLIIPNDKDVKKIEFRLSKQGYKTVVVKPFKDVLIGCGPLLMISLDKIKPLGDNDIEEAPQQTAVTPVPVAAPIPEEPINVAEAMPAKAVAADEPIVEENEAVEAAPIEEEEEVVVPIAPVVPEKKARFSVDQQTLDFAETGGQKNVLVTADTEWTVSQKPDWIQTKKNKNTLTIICSANTRQSAREADVVLTDKGKQELVIIVAQDKNNDYINLSANIIKSKGKKSAYVVKVSSNKNWDVTTFPMWCDIQRNGEELTVTLEQNRSGSERQGEIEISSSSETVHQVIKVVQAFQHFLSISPMTITAADGKSGTATINVDTDCESYTFEDLPNWCSIRQQTQTSFILDIHDNLGGRAREAQCRVIAADQTALLTVKQGERLADLTVSPKLVSASQNGGVITIKVQSSSTWRIVNLPEWCEIKSQTDNDFILRILKNDTAEPRTATFSVSVSGVRENITVQQD